MSRLKLLVTCLSLLCKGQGYLTLHSRLTKAGSKLASRPTELSPLPYENYVALWPWWVALPISDSTAVSPAGTCRDKAATQGRGEQGGAAVLKVLGPVHRPDRGQREGFALSWAPGHFHNQVQVQRSPYPVKGEYLQEWVPGGVFKWLLRGFPW